MTNLTFHQLATTTTPVEEYLADTIKNHLANGERVLWLVPGGSSIPVVAKVSHALQNVPRSQLSVSLTDERFGEVGHPDSNWLQLHDAGFSLPGAKLQPILCGESLASTVKLFAAFLQEQLKTTDYRIGFFGMGADGHIAGILPNSSAVLDDKLAHGYKAKDFQRITITPTMVTGLDEAVVYAVGEPKWQSLELLTRGDTDNWQPVQILRQVPKVTIYSDYKGGGR